MMMFQVGHETPGAETEGYGQHGLYFVESKFQAEFRAGRTYTRVVNGEYLVPGMIELPVESHSGM